jgi:hypothetical protein
MQENDCQYKQPRSLDELDMGQKRLVVGPGGLHLPAWMSQKIARRGKEIREESV